MEYARAIGLDEVIATPLDPERLRDVLASDAVARWEHTLTRGRELLAARTFWNVNSTARGGGVAEMLLSLIGYARGASLDVRWLTITGDPDFFRITKRLHNRLHGHDGDGGPLGEAERAVYEKRSATNAELMLEQLGPRDVVLLHDPQTAGMIRLLSTGAPVDVALARGRRSAQRPGAGSMGLPDALRRARRRLRLLPSALRLGGPGSAPS